MSVWKYLVLLAGIIGLLGFFLPFIDVHTSNARFGRHPSAFELVRRLEGLDAMTLDLTKLGLGDAQAREMAQQAHVQLEQARTAASVIYAPAALLAILGAVCGARRRMGRLAGFLALVLGAVSASVWAIFYYVASRDPHHAATMGLGANLLLACGAAAAVAGIGALILPDRGASDLPPPRKRR
ncbi:MAG: hypothetical protein JO257_02770 [Deltaproteobacteria bacterium]|nr:hypothetical protein [Deltaproteobacteria bacterium]